MEKEKKQSNKNRRRRSSQIEIGEEAGKEILSGSLPPRPSDQMI